MTFEIRSCVKGRRTPGVVGAIFSIALSFLPACSSTSGGSGPEPDAGDDGAAQGDASDAAATAMDAGDGAATSLEGGSADGAPADASPDAASGDDSGASTDAAAPEASSGDDGEYFAGTLSASPSPEFSGSVSVGTGPITGLDVTFSPAALGARTGTVSFTGYMEPVCTPPIQATGTGTAGSCASASPGTPCLTSGVCVNGTCTTQLLATGNDFSFSAGSSLTTTVGTVTDALTSDSAAALSVSMAWGDGTTSAGVVSGSSSPFTLSGTHTYASASLVTGSVTVTDSSTGNTATAAFAAGPQITVTPYSTGADYPAGIASGSDGNLWFPAVGKVYYGTTSGVVSSFTDPGIQTTTQGSSLVQDIVLGPDGNVWYAAEGSVDRCSPAGTTASFTPTGQPFAFAASTSAVWFTESETDKVASISPSGTINEFSLAFQSSPQAIAFGADGNVWFFEEGSQNIGRMSTTDGGLSEFPASTTSNVSVSAMITGPDGNVWLAADSSFIKVAPNETITTYPIPGASYGRATGGIAVDSNGDLWTTSFGQYWLARITTSGTVSVYFAPNLSLGAITSGSDGNLWAIDTSTAQLVRITLPP